MGIDCSNCKCTNRDDEKILIIENSEKIYSSKADSRKEKLELMEKGKNAKKINFHELLAQKPSLVGSLVKLQSMARKYRHRKTYKAILKKFRVKQ